jgi:HK97 gp10 family phage protein
VPGIEITGTAEVADALQRLGERVDAPTDALDEIARQGAAQLRAAAPRRTGRLARSITGRRIGGRAVITAGNGSAPYAPFPAYGTRDMAADPFLKRTDVRLTRDAGDRIEHDLDQTIRRTGLDR